MRFIAGAAVNIKSDTEILETFTNDVVVAIHHFLRSDAFFSGSQCDWNAMLIAAAYEQHFFTGIAHVTHVSICRQINSGNVPDVNRSIGIRKRSGNGGF